MTSGLPPCCGNAATCSTRSRRRWPESSSLARSSARRRKPCADWRRDGDLATLGRLNDASYPFGDDSFSRGLRRLPDGAAHIYLANSDGEPVGCLATIDHEGNAEVQLVAVLPQARGRGVAGKLLAHALADAAERGARSTTLIATKLGLPVYERAGYRALGRFQMWERARAAAAI